MKCSVCLSTYNKATFLSQVLDSIFRQSPPFDMEVIVVDDGSSDNTPDVCWQFVEKGLNFIRIERKPTYRNPSVARNVAYRAARGEVLVCQSDDVVHVEPDTIERLVLDLQPGTFSIATVHNTDGKGNDVKRAKTAVFTGEENPRPLFFLGALFRSDLYRAGGCDERFTFIGREDVAFGESLMIGLGLSPQYVSIRGNHLHHPRPDNLREMYRESNQVYFQLKALRCAGLESWLSPGAPWPYTK